MLTSKTPLIVNITGVLILILNIMLYIQQEPGTMPVYFTNVLTLVIFFGLVVPVSSTSFFT